MTEKKMKVVSLTSIYLDYEKLDHAIEKLSSLKEQYTAAGFTKLQINYGYYDSYDDKESLYLTGERLETDEEYNKRITVEKANEEKRQKYELEQLKALKEKYEK